MCKQLMKKLLEFEKNHDYENILKQINEIISKCPEKKEKLLLKKSLAQIQLEKHTQAIETLEEYLKICDEEEKYTVYLSLAGCHNILGNKDTAEKYILKAYEENQDYTAQKKVISFYYLNKEYEKCIEFIKMLKEQDKADIEDLIDLTYCYNNLNQYEKGIECAKEVLEIDPSNVDMYITLTISYENIGDMENLIDCYEKIIKLDTIEDEQLQLIKAQAYLALGDEKKAIEYVDKTIKNAPYNPMNYIMKGMLFNGMGKSQEAMECFQEAEKLDSEILQKMFEKKVK